MNQIPHHKLAILALAVGLLYWDYSGFPGVEQLAHLQRDVDTVISVSAKAREAAAVVRSLLRPGDRGIRKEFLKMAKLIRAGHLKTTGDIKAALTRVGDLREKSGPPGLADAVSAALNSYVGPEDVELDKDTREKAAELFEAMGS